MCLEWIGWEGQPAHKLELALAWHWYVRWVEEFWVSLFGQFWGFWPWWQFPQTLHLVGWMKFKHSTACDHHYVRLWSGSCYNQLLFNAWSELLGAGWIGDTPGARLSFGFPSQWQDTPILLPRILTAPFDFWNSLCLSFSVPSPGSAGGCVPDTLIKRHIANYQKEPAEFIMPALSLTFHNCFWLFYYSSTFSSNCGDRMQV